MAQRDKRGLTCLSCCEVMIGIWSHKIRKLCWDNCGGFALDSSGKDIKPPGIKEVAEKIYRRRA